jgi:hypothetical protein
LIVHGKRSGEDLELGKRSHVQRETIGSL